MNTEDVRRERERIDALIAAIEESMNKLPYLREELRKLRKLCPHANKSQPNYWKVCDDCGHTWPGT